MPASDDIAASGASRTWTGPRSALAGRALTVLLLGAWILAACAGLRVLWTYENGAGVAAEPPARWPAESRLARTPGRPTLVVLLHPGCPCSRATVDELDRLMAEADGRLAVHVLFYKPHDFADGWERTDLWTKAAAIPGAHVSRDDDGTEARRFGAATSGQVVLYDARGALRFSGGITPARGHAGDNAGRSAIVASLSETAPAASARTPVFGCSLRDPDVAPRRPDAL